MKSLKKFLTVLLIVTFLVVTANVVLATEYENETVFIQDEGNNNTNANSLFGNNTTNNNTTNNTVNNTINNTVNNVTNNNTNNANSSTYNSSNLPKAGSTDSFVVIAIIVAFGASALYAYKKIRDYNIK